MGEREDEGGCRFKCFSVIGIAIGFINCDGKGGLQMFALYMYNYYK